MGRSLDVTIAYGVNLEGGDCSWKLKEDPRTYQPEAGLWFDPENYSEDFLSCALREYLTQKGVEVPQSADSHDLAVLLRKNTGLALVDHGYGDSSQYAIVTFSKTTYDAIGIFHPENLQTQDTGEWDKQLAEFFTSLGITPLQTRPEWLVCASYG